jgi:hypothetical protein
VESIDKRLEDLERLVEPPEDEGTERRRALMREVLNELASLRASGAAYYRAGVRVEPEDIPTKILGPGYSREQLWELAERRVFEREREDVPGSL